MKQIDHHRDAIRERDEAIADSRKDYSEACAQIRAAKTTLASCGAPHDEFDELPDMARNAAEEIAKLRAEVDRLETERTIDYHRAEKAERERDASMDLVMIHQRHIAKLEGLLRECGNILDAHGIAFKWRDRIDAALSGGAEGSDDEE